MQCPGGRAPEGVPRRACPGGRAPEGVPRRACPGGRAPEGVPRRACPGGRAPEGVPRRACPGGRAPEGVPRRACPGGRAPEKPVDHDAVIGILGGVGGPIADHYGDRDAEYVRIGDTVNQGAAIGVPRTSRP